MVFERRKGKMANDEAVKETRQGTIFSAHVGRQRFGKIPVHLFIEGQGKSVGTIKIHLHEGIGSATRLVDEAFQRWVTDGLFRKTIKDSGFLFSALTVAERERREGVLWYRRTYRFLPAKGLTCQNPRFILTADKSDLSDHYRRVLEVGEEVVLREEAEQDKARKLLAEEERGREERLRTEYKKLICETAKAAINEKSVSAGSIRTLSELGLLKPSTAFRGGELFPGESSVLWYDFTEEEVRYAGYIGFDSNLQLLSVDERFPRDNEVYIRASIY
jgi:hypothetical protein